MTSVVTDIRPPGTIVPRQRVQEFIALAKFEIEVLVTNEDWKENVWSVGDSFITKGQNRNNRVLAFITADSSLSNRQVITGECLHPDFVDFAKAYCRYTHSTSPVAFENQRKRLAALQFIEAGFRKLAIHPAIEKCTVSVLNSAVELAKQGVSIARHYQFALYIQQIHQFCMSRGFFNGPFQWRHGVRKPKDKTEAIGEEARKWREKKLPSPEAYHGLAYIYCNAETFIDRLYSAVSAICCAVPIRAHEVLQLREDCEVHELIRTPDSADTTEAYGIRVWPGKGNPPQVKWVPTPMVSVVKGAVARLREICTDARKVSKWYEENPGQLWLPIELAHWRSSGWLPLDLVNEIVPARNLYALTNWAKTKGIEVRTQKHLGKKVKEVHHLSLETHLLGLLPKEFPFFNGANDQRYSDCLVVLLYNQGHIQRGTYRCLVEKATVTAFEHWLSGHDGGAKPSVFNRWNITERDGSDLEITTHAFRHWLNTVAQLTGMSELDIAKWSGRDAAQNKAYNHVTPEEILSQMREALDDGLAIGPMFEPPKMQGINKPVDQRDFMDAQIGSAHITDSGICVHDYSLLPCQIHGNCLGCSENVFIKGNAIHIRKIETRLPLAERQLDEALQAMGDGYDGSDRWVAVHTKNIERMRLILSIHNDPSIADGTLINLPAVKRH
ncbi:MAG: hypothetical protein KUA43_01805 [Hoeflea sp.]|uniref:hypothetical protein n=1 Tax=Hoeflea sp. TaxID=1940281 RepID=UPI001D40597B|nr:hypothetical protein [Hoeflea sp.]MBU4530609.1 hypothetical protein [Alphaproteobacteria bacterium]MBU4544829.1 hypothetical protein [Alphaproteobacteria bacterium]MBU4551972.1 hypothetical protein [Alphaproteobacteria bacterium]MBV1722160.1 hypothetical protein [Hoeflea sp.]MBV1761722.1 hypothetical protein [Hoeflea sp.]